MTTYDINAFLGPIASVDPSLIDAMHSQRELNARHGDARLQSRYGYHNLRAPQTGFTAVYGLVYLHGYNTSDAEVEEYVGFEHLGANVAAYSRHVTTGAETPITGATSLNASDWAGFSFDRNGYLINPAETAAVVRHVIGDTTSWVAIVTPPDPTVTLTWRIDFVSGGGAPYATLSWAGTDAADVTVTGSCTTTNISVDGSGVLSLQHAASSNQFSSFEVDLNGITAGIQNLQYNDLYAFGFSTPVSGVFKIDPHSVTFQFTNNDGTPKTMVPTGVELVTVAANQFAFRLHFANKTRADWDNIRKVKVSYQVVASSGTATNNILRVFKVVLGCCDMLSRDPPSGRTPGRQAFGYTFYNSTVGGGLESGIAGYIEVPNAQLRGTSLGAQYGNIQLGAWVTFTHAASTAADKVRYYWEDPDGQFRRLTTQDDTTLTFTLQMDYAEMLAATVYNDGPFKTDQIVNGFAYREWAVWLTAEGSANVRHSRVGDAEATASDLDEDDDENRGANFTLADDFGDVPLAGCQAGPSCIVGGSNGVYEQVGDRPWNMSPPKKLPGSFGIANKFALVRFKDDRGNAGAAFVDLPGTGVYFAYPSNTQFTESEGRVISLSQVGLGTLLRTFLMQEQSLTDFSTCRVFVDEWEDALWVLMGKRAMVLRRPTPAAKSREWELYEYNTGTTSGTFKYAAASAKRRLRVMRSTGQFDELEWNQAAAVYVQGVDRDGGNPMPQGYWRTKLFGNRNERIHRLEVKRDPFYTVVKIRAWCRRRSQMYQIQKGSETVKCLPEQQGDQHYFEFILDESGTVITGFRAFASVTGRRWNL